MSAVAEELVGVGDLDPAALLAEAASADLAERRAASRKLQLAYQWAVAHPATGETGIATPGGPALDVLAGEESLGGDGTPAVAAFTPEPFALAVGLTPAAGAALIGDALDLRHRLPLLWKRVLRLEVPAWQARRVAQQTHRLPLAGARWVDERLAARVRGGLGPVVVDRLVAQAAAEFDPESQQQVEEDAEAGWDVSISTAGPTDFDGTSHLTATGDTPTLADFHALVCEIAHQFLLDGDTSPLGVRKIKAVRLITRAARSHSAASDAATDTRSGGRVQLHVHVEAADLDVDADGSAAFAAGRVEKLGAATLARIRQWVAHEQVVIRPVLNLARGDSIDVHDPPEWMRELVILRDGHCVFPRCTRDARSCDLDHIQPYESDGRPGQTHPAALAALCRRHHRAKTAGAWRYWRTPEGDYAWTGPHAASYLVTPAGTTRLQH